MKKKSPFDGLVIRTAVVRLPDVGYIIAGNLYKEKEEIPHAIIVRWKSGVLNHGDCNYEAHTVCVIENPEVGFIYASEQGYYSVTTINGCISGDIHDNSQPPPIKPRYGGFRSVSEIGGKAYIVGLRGMVYRLDQIKMWTRIDDGLPDSFDIQAIHGFNASDIYAVGREGELWQYNGKIWTQHEMPTNVNFTNVKCAGDGKVYIVGHDGMLVCGVGATTWKVIDHDETDDDFWDVEWFEGDVYISSMNAVYRLNGELLEKVDFGDDAPKSCYQLSTAEGVMWSNGEYDIMAYDGKTWTRII